MDEMKEDLYYLWAFPGRRWSYRAWKCGSYSGTICQQEGDVKVIYCWEYEGAILMPVD